MSLEECWVKCSMSLCSRLMDKESQESACKFSSLIHLGTKEDALFMSFESELVLVLQKLIRCWQHLWMPYGYEQECHTWDILYWRNPHLRTSTRKRVQSQVLSSMLFVWISSEQNHKSIWLPTGSWNSQVMCSWRDITHVMTSWCNVLMILRSLNNILNVNCPFQTHGHALSVNFASLMRG